jgi:hypothetical protein
VGCAACHGDQRSDEVIEALRRGLAAPPEEADEPEGDAEATQKSPVQLRADFLMPLGRLGAEVFAVRADSVPARAAHGASIGAYAFAESFA